MSSAMIENTLPQKTSEAIKTLHKLENIGSSPLLTIKTVFPFRFFPCFIKLDREKITISNHLFFFTREIENVLIKDLVSITTTENLLFSNITIVSGLRLNKKISNSFFWNEDAQKLRRLCEGLRIAVKEKVNVMNIANEDLIMRLEEIGGTTL